MKVPESRQSEFMRAFGLVSHEFSLKVQSDYRYIRSLKFNHRADGSWTCIIATYNAEFLPAICIGTGESIYGCLRSAARSMAQSQFKDDEYAKPDDFQDGEILSKLERNNFNLRKGLE